MDDASAITKDETVTQILKESKISIDRLHEAKPSHDISIKSETTPESKPTTDLSKTVPTNENETTKPSDANNTPTQPHENYAKIETVFEKMNIASEKAESTTDSIDSAKDKDIIKTENKPQSNTGVPPLDFENKGRSQKPQDNIFVAETTVSRRNSATLYSVKGSPSGRIYRKRDSNTNVFPAGCMGCKEDFPLEAKPSPRRFLDPNEASKDFAGHLENTPRKRPISGRQDIQRNPLTGVGMEPTESRRQMIKRKDGNPLLGTGYEESSNTSSSNRIPPGGYSQGLW